VSDLARGVERLLAAVLRQRRRLGLEPSPLTLTQGQALAILGDGGPLRIGVIASALGVTDATASRTIDALAALGLAERFDDPTDRRAVLAATTPAGAQLLTQRRADFTALVDELLGHLDEAEARRLAELLEELDDILQGRLTLSP
jgi:DNA-binding MarR family transcriptional regulator